MKKKLLLAIFLSQALSVAAYAEVAVTSITRLTDGGRVDWSADGKKIAFDRFGKDGFTDVWVMEPDGTEQKCLTCEAGDKLPQRHNGQPAWHPSGKWIVFQSQKKDSPKYLNPIASPGAGILNDIWIMTPDGKEFYQLVDLELRKKNLPGTLHPHFSHDGKKLFWVERVGNGKGSYSKCGMWVMKVADFTEEGGTPKLVNIKTYTPGEQQDFYESHGFSPDDSKVLFCGNLKPKQSAFEIDIYEMDLATGDLEILTDEPRFWDEHAQYSPDGKKIVWMSSRGVKLKGGLRTEYWIMDADGSNKKQLTFFNTPGHPHYRKTVTAASDSSFNPDGTKFVAYLTDSANHLRNGSIVIISLGEKE